MFTSQKQLYSPVVASTWHLAFPTMMEAFSLPKPVPVTVKRVPRPLEPETLY